MPLIDAGGTRLFHELSGPADAPVVAFSNSIGTTLEMWDAQARALSGRYRVLRYDTRGHGRSPVRDGPATVDDLADDLAALLTALGIERAHVVGLSLGGMTAQSLAARHGHRVDRLVLMATAAHLPGGWEERAATVRRDGMGAIVDAVIARWFTPAFRTAPEVTALRDRFLANDPEGYAICCGAIAAMDLRPALPSIAAPTLIVAGADDPATPPAMGETLRAGIPDAELLVLPRAAHILAIERAELVNARLLAFLAPEGPPGASFAAGLLNRKRVLGEAHVERSLAAAGPFATPWQEFITRTAWGEIWGDPTIPWKSRSMLTLALMVALGREEEFKLHVRPALRNGVTLPELRALLIQCAVYAGVPAANGAFRWVRDVLGEELDA
jgi:3-oxoadipate enol-lactonase / 4-carboxymuconolactone decarboxylase